jgi:hypothetical protein
MWPSKILCLLLKFSCISGKPVGAAFSMPVSYDWVIIRKAEEVRCSTGYYDLIVYYGHKGRIGLLGWLTRKLEFLTSSDIFTNNLHVPLR